MMVTVKRRISSASTAAFLCMLVAPTVGFSLLPEKRSVTAVTRSIPQRGLALCAASSSTDDVDVATEIDTEWSMVESISVQTLDNQTSTLNDLIDSTPKKTVILSCLSHFGDFNAWELTQQYIAAINSGRIDTSESSVVLVGIGSVASAQQFAKDLELDKKYADQLTLLADENGSMTDALGCYRGWLNVDAEHRERYPESDVSPYLKLLGMIFGFGSPGTIPRVLYGYIGDWENDQGTTGRKWVVDSLLQGTDKGRFPPIKEESFAEVPKDSALRPFELATLRLQTGLHIVSKFGTLGPKNNGDLLTRMGGTFVFSNSGECVWSYFDQGILVYANIEDICNVADAAAKGVRYMPPSDTKALKADRKRLREGGATS